MSEGWLEDQDAVQQCLEKITYYLKDGGIANLGCYFGIAGVKGPASSPSQFLASCSEGERSSESSWGEGYYIAWL